MVGNDLHALIVCNNIIQCTCVTWEKGHTVRYRVRIYWRYSIMDGT